MYEMCVSLNDILQKLSGIWQELSGILQQSSLVHENQKAPWQRIGKQRRLALSFIWLSWHLDTIYLQNSVKSQFWDLKCERKQGGTCKPFKFWKRFSQNQHCWILNFDYLYLDQHIWRVVKWFVLLKIQSSLTSLPRPIFCTFDAECLNHAVVFHV